MPPKRKPENRGLPTRWRNLRGAYYYDVPHGLEAQWDEKRIFRLGKSLPEAYKTWATRIGMLENARTIGQLLDRYALEVVPTKAITTQAGNEIFISKLRGVFGDMPIESIRPKMIYQYVNKRTAKVSAHRRDRGVEPRLHQSRRMGYIDRHPFKGEVRLEGEKPRNRYVEDWEIVECLSLPSVRKKGSVLAIQAYMRIKLMTGMARGDLLRLSVSNLQDDGIHIMRHKTAGSSGKRTIYEWTPDLRAAIDLAKSVRPVLSPFLFCNRLGHCYINEATGLANGWDTMWQHFMERILKETKGTQRFTEHDLRAKCASDAESLDHARALLSHADGRTTERIYRRRPERVTPQKSG